jgi:hypothetical protein
MDAREIFGLAIVAGYWAVLIGTRWMFIARPNRRFTLARIDDAQYDLQRDADPQRATLLDEARDIAGLGDDDCLHPIWLKQRRACDQEVPKRGWVRRLLSAVARPFIWNGSRDLVAFLLLHREQARAVRTLEGGALRAALIRVQSQLGELPPESRQYWKSHISTCLGTSGVQPPEDEARALLEECLIEIYDARDTKFVNLATQQNKVTWLITVALVLMAALVSLGYEVVLLAGAVGGILSRLQRELTRRDVPSDYGLSWAVLFLSPVTGALSAWAGLFVLLALQALGVVDLTNLLPAGVSLGAPPDAAIGVAMVLGISERFLQGIVKQVTKEITPAPEEAAKEARSRLAPAPETT